MPYQVTLPPPVEVLHLATIVDMFNTHKTLYDFGYRGLFSTTTSSDEEGVISESGRFDMVMAGNVPIVASLGDVILYSVSPLAVVACMPSEEFAARYVPVA
jgi:hypothetical protein